MTGQIKLEGLEFHAFHGVYPHERETGNWFEVDVSVEADISQAAHSDQLTDALNYETIFQLVKAEMDKPSHLLEKVAAQIVLAIFNAMPAAKAVHLKLSKVNPPIGGKCKRATIEIKQSRT
jgi:dihydroneopterin aldolase